AADSMPPGYYLLESLTSKLIPNQQIAFRLPSILATAFTICCLFVWMKRRYGSEVAFVGALLPLLTVLDSTYAVEARSYALVVAFLSFGLVCYDRVPALGWTVLLAMSLVLAEASHYYAIFAMIPFVAAELVDSLKRKQIRWPAWGAFACG